MLIRGMLLHHIKKIKSHVAQPNQHNSKTISLSKRLKYAGHRTFNMF